MLGGKGGVLIDELHLLTTAYHSDQAIITEKRSSYVDKTRIGYPIDSG